MNAFAAIRGRLKVTQKEMADALGVSQGNVSFYEVKDQTVPPQVARRLIAFAKERGVALTFDSIYGDPPAGELSISAKLTQAQVDAIRAAYAGVMVGRKKAPKGWVWREALKLGMTECGLRAVLMCRTYHPDKVAACAAARAVARDD